MSRTGFHNSTTYWVPMSSTLDFLNLYSFLTPIGIESVTNQSKNIKSFLEKWYGCSNYSDAYQVLRGRLSKISTAKVCIIGYPCDNGAALLRGSKFGPMALRSYLYEKNPKIISSWDKLGIVDVGDIFDHPLLVHDSMYEPWVLDHVREARWNSLKEFPVSPLSLLQAVIEHLYHVNPKIKIVILGGDHSLSFIPTEYLSLTQNIGVIHFDAHTDLLTTRQGLPYSYATWAWRANQCIGRGNRMLQIGIRETTKSQSEWESKEEVMQLWSNEILKDEEKALETLEQLIEKMPSKKVYLSFDIDVLSSQYVKATGTCSENGLSPLFIDKALDLIKNKTHVIAADLVELAPSLSRNDPEEPKRSLEIAGNILIKIINLLSK